MCCALVDLAPALRRGCAAARDKRSRAYSISDPCARDCGTATARVGIDGANLPSEAAVVPCQRSLPTAFVHSASAAARVPGRHVDTIGDIADRHLVRRPAREQRLEQLPAHHAMQAADAVHRAAAAYGEIRHVERLGRIVRVLRGPGPAARRPKSRATVRRSRSTGALDEIRREAVEPRRHRRVGGEEICRRGSRPAPPGRAARSLP